jgi:hypothetical protein
MNNQVQVQKTILDELGLTDLPQEKKEALLIKMTEVILKRIFVETMEKLVPEAQEEYAKLIEANATPEEVENFLAEKIPNYDELIKKTVDEFVEEMKK